MSCNFENGCKSASKAGKKLKWRVAVEEERASHAWKYWKAVQKR